MEEIEQLLSEIKKQIEETDQNDEKRLKEIKKRLFHLLVDLEFI